jgi:hypothetical protein
MQECSTQLAAATAGTAAAQASPWQELESLLLVSAIVVIVVTIIIAIAITAMLLTSLYSDCLFFRRAVT